MDEGYNFTFLTLGGHVEIDRYRYLYFMIVFLVYIFIICGNSVIVYLIWIHQDLHEPMYIFIAALLLNSLLYSTNIYPKLLIDFLSEKQIISHQACVLQYFMFYTLSCSEFLLLAAMAYDRYVSICKPLQYSMIMRKKTVGMLLAVAWLLPACQLTALAILTANQKICGFTLKVIFCNNSIYKLHCVWSRVISLFGALILVNAILLPILFILFTYAKIFIITYKHSIEVRKKAAQTCLPHLLVLINYSCLIIFDVVLVRIESDLSKTAQLIITLQMILYHPLFNPIIYGLKMKEISKHLKTLFSQCKIS
ncbi:olfactory receptor 6N2-like [Parambassis ranga]|uniref:Olfactory receptor n=1 Tax=Parambassis ranga TaxID=210632 RepID=A0A6P7H3J2_9TELE|nr:olfactory receptor 6N2-like [Parambassis ranga]